MSLIKSWMAKEDRDYFKAVYGLAFSDPDLYNLSMVITVSPRVVRLFMESIISGTYKSARRRD